MTGTSDAVVEAAAKEIQRVVEGWMNYDDEDWTLLARAALAAAEGPWREHLAADAEALKGGMLGTSQFAYGYRTACVDLAARIVQRGTDE